MYVLVLQLHTCNNKSLNFVMPLFKEGGVFCITHWLVVWYVSLPLVQLLNGEHLTILTSNLLH